jgi:hypothetical protein
MSDGGRPPATRRRATWYLAALVGVLAVGGALAVLLVPSFRDSLPVAALVDRAGSDYLLVAVVGGSALVALLAMLVARAAGSVRQATPPDPEFAARVPRPGEGFDDRVAGPGSGVRRDADVDGLRDRLGETATRTLMRTRNLPRERARDLVERGAWTDRPLASAFLAGERVPWSAAARAALRGQGRHALAASETAEAIVRLAAADRPTATDRSAAPPDEVETAAGSRSTAAVGSRRPSSSGEGDTAATDGGAER